MFAEAIFKKECNCSESIILHHVPNTTANPIYDSSSWFLKATGETLIEMVFDDYQLTKTLPDLYSWNNKETPLWKVYIIILTLAAYYYNYGTIPDIYNYGYYYPPLKPAATVTTSNTPASSAPKTPVKTRQQLIDEVGRAAAKFHYRRYTGTTREYIIKHGYGDCWAMSDYLYHELEKRGINARILNYKTSQSNNHRTVQIHNGKSWVNFDYVKYNIEKNFRVGSNYKYGKVLSGHA